ncbi:hypothetical protein [Primorskyibacter sp. S187A]|uniref:hypothetical protein n=1 Tax=Primorskyibacter sp. S187A TaxID=3415130 RepID=UPI003C7E6162
MRVSFPLLSLCAALGLAACAQFPQLDAVEEGGVDTAPYPQLLPLEQLTEGPALTATPQVRSGILARAESLRARAARLSNRPVIDTTTRRRMARGVRRAR